MSPRPPFPLREASSGPGALEPQDLWPGLAKRASAQLLGSATGPSLAWPLSHPPVPCPSSSQARVRCHVAPTCIPPRALCLL